MQKTAQAMREKVIQ